MTRQTITVNGYVGVAGWPKTVKAEVYGALAIHRCLDPECYGCGWRIAHVPTGYAIARPFKRKAEALTALRICAAFKVKGRPVDWSTLTEDQAKAFPKAARNRLRDAMLELGSSL